MKRIKRACKCLKLISKKYLHFGRVNASAMMDMEEVKHDIKRDVGNWKNDTYDNHYGSKLPLSGMRSMAGFDARRGYHCNPRANFFGEDKHKCLPMMIFTFIENKLDMLRLTKEECPTAKGFLEMLQNLRWVIIQDCAVLRKKEQREHVIFEMFPHIFKSDLFQDFSEKMMDYLEFCEKKDPLAQSIDNVLPGVKQCLSNQTDAIYENGKSIKKVDVDICDLAKLIETQNVNGHITSSWESFTKYLGNYKPPLSLDKAYEEKDIEQVVPVKELITYDYTMNDMQNIPCRIKTFEELIIVHERMMSNSKVSINNCKRNVQKRYHRIKFVLTMYYNSTDENKLLIYSKMLKESHGSIYSVYRKLKKRIA